MRISDWSSDVCSSDLLPIRAHSALIMQMALPPATIQDNEKLSMTNADSCGPSAKPPSCAAGIKTAALPPSSTAATVPMRSEEHTSELQSLMRISYAVFCLKKKKIK